MYSCFEGKGFAEVTLPSDSGPDTDPTMAPQQIELPVSTRLEGILRPDPFNSVHGAQAYGEQVERGDFGPGYVGMQDRIRRAGGATDGNRPITAIHSHPCKTVRSNDPNVTLESVLGGAEFASDDRYAGFLLPGGTMHTILQGSPESADTLLAKMTQRTESDAGVDREIEGGSSIHWREAFSMRRSRQALQDIRAAESHIGMQLNTIEEPVLVFPRRADGSVDTEAEGTWHYGMFAFRMTPGQVAPDGSLAASSGSV
jgi:hypothetical protein